MSMIPQHFLLLLSGGRPTLAQVLDSIANKLTYFDGTSVPDVQALHTIIENAAYTTALGANIISNGTFDSAITDWAAAGVGTCEWSNTTNAGGTAGEMHSVVPTRTSDQSQINITCEDGATYQIALRASVIASNLETTQTGGGVFYSAQSFGNGLINAVVRAINSGATARVFRLRGTGNNAEFYTDNIAIQKLSQCDGDLEGGVTHEPAGGEGGQGRYLFDGVNDHILVYNHAALTGLTNMLIAAHLNITTLGADMTLLNKSGRFLLTIKADGTIDFTANYATTNARAISTTAITTGNHTLMVGISGTTPMIFIDGVEVTYSAPPTAGVGAPASNTNNWYIGATAALGAFLVGGLQKLLVAATAPSAALASNFHVARLG